MACCKPCKRGTGSTNAAWRQRQDLDPGAALTAVATSASTRTRTGTGALRRSASAFTLLLLIALAGASSTRAAEPQQGRADSAAEGPSIKALFEEALVVDGRNIEQEAWRQAQDDCRQAGYPIRTLSEAQASLLGVTTIEFAQDIDRRYRPARMDRCLGQNTGQDARGAGRHRPGAGLSAVVDHSLLTVLA